MPSDMEVRGGGEGGLAAFVQGTAMLWAHLPLPEAVPLCLMGAGTRACGVENARGLLPAAFVSHLPPMPLHLRREMTISNRVSVTDAVGILSLG